jgi:hypothetical protein
VAGGRFSRKIIPHCGPIFKAETEISRKGKCGNNVYNKYIFITKYIFINAYNKLWRLCALHRENVEFCRWYEEKI